MNRETLEKAHTQLTDLLRGWSERELCEPLSATIQRLEAALAESQNVYVVHCPDNFEEPVFVFDTETAAELFHDSKPGSFVTTEPVLDMQFAKEETE